jgi:hypothetical protein
MELYLHSPNTPSWRGAQLGGAQLDTEFPHDKVLTSRTGRT